MRPLLIARSFCGTAEMPRGYIRSAAEKTLPFSGEFAYVRQTCRGARRVASCFSALDDLALHLESY